LNPRPHEAQLEDQKPKKSSRRSSKLQNQQMERKMVNQRKSKEKLKLKTPHNTLNVSSLP
jgi:hypothetical protein